MYLLGLVIKFFCYFLGSSSLLWCSHGCYYFEFHLYGKPVNGYFTKRTSVCIISTVLISKNTLKSIIIMICNNQSFPYGSNFSNICETLWNSVSILYICENASLFDAILIYNEKSIKIFRSIKISFQINFDALAVKHIMD